MQASMLVCKIASEASAFELNQRRDSHCRSCSTVNALFSKRVLAVLSAAEQQIVCGWQR